MEAERGRKIGSVGSYVKVKWNDAVQHIKVHAVNAADPEEHMAKCESVGELIVDHPKALILAQHWSDTDGIDILVIPRDWVQEIEVLEEGEKCTTESLEYQQELEEQTQQKKSKDTSIVGTA